MMRKFASRFANTKRTQQFGSKRTKLAPINTDVGLVQMDVGVIERQVPVLPLTNHIRQLTQRQDVDFVLKKHSVVKR